MTSKVTKNGIIITQGDSLSLPICFKNMDITGATIRMQVRDSAGKVFIDNITKEHIDPLHGKSLITLSKDETSIPIGEYKTDIEINMADGSRHTFYPAQVGAVAYFIVTEQITKD